jgi:putative membrane protein
LPGAEAITLRWLLAAVHLLALGIGLGAVWVRGRGLRSVLDRDGLRRVFLADGLWGAAAALWLGTGVWRLLAGLEKPTGYYLANHLFLTKMGLFLAILALEISPMLTLIRWRRLVRLGQPLDTSSARRMSTISFVQAWLIVLMVLAATAMARGIGA